MKILLKIDILKILLKIDILKIYVAIILFGGHLVATADIQDIPKIKQKAVYKNASREVISQLTYLHYVKYKVNDKLSDRLFDSYLKKLDPSKSYFSQIDINSFEPHRNKLDDYLKIGSLDFVFDAFNLYQERRIARLEYILDLLNVESQDLQGDLLIDRSEEPWPENITALHKLWQKQLKSTQINLLLSGKEAEEVKELLFKRYDRRKRLALQANSEDVLQIYLNSLASLYGPHTAYFSPRASEDFNIRMSLSLEGIGAVLNIENEYARIVRLVPSGPADLGGELKVADRILAVSEENNKEMTDVVGWRLDDIVSKIRGPKGSRVILKVMSSGQSEADARIIAIVRDKVSLEDQSAKSEILNFERAGENFKVGVITLPSFYVDTNAVKNKVSNYRSATKDVQRLLLKLEAENVHGIVVDLRNNGGGSLEEARTLTGLFLPEGPIVQVRNSKNRITVLGDRNDENNYTGPLVVLTNRFSASAAEIFAGAIQDYGRGLVVGAQTYGKGTVQTIASLSHGQLKFTQGKFYRISGESTQNLGVIPDIVMPSKIHQKDDFGETSLEGALLWDTINPRPYRKNTTFIQSPSVLAKLTEAHRTRIKNNPNFTYMKNVAEYRYMQRERKSLSLDKEKRQQQRELDENWFKDQKSILKVAIALQSKAKNASESAQEATQQQVPTLSQNTDVNAQILPQEALNTSSETEELLDEHLNEGQVIVDAREGNATDEGGAGAEKSEEEEEEDNDIILQESSNILLDYYALNMKKITLTLTTQK